jgi:hypothetical protein
LKQQFLATLLAAGSFFGTTEVRASDDFDSRDVLIRFKSESTVAERSEFEQREELILIKEIRSIRVRLYRLPIDADVEITVARYGSIPIIDFAEPDYHRQQSSVSDPDYPLQWALNNTGQQVNGFAGPADFDINWPEAMGRFNGTTPIIVAVVDSGLSLVHPDILGKVFVNDVELDGISGFDDDGNFVVDDFLGYDFYSDNSFPADENGHGTLVSSIIAARADNGLGGVGISPTAQIMPLRVLNQFARSGIPKYARVSDVAFALDYAGRMGANIVNLSLGGESYSSTEFWILTLLSEANVLVVAAAGNGGGDGVGDNIDVSPIYPAAYNVENLLSVAAQDRTGGLANFSNYGITNVDLAAPGTNIYGADITRQTLFSENFESGAPGWIVGDNFGNLSSDTWLIDVLSGNHYLTDHSSPDTNYLANADTWVRSPLIDLDGSVGSRLVFDTVMSLADDYLVVELSFDGINWSIYKFYSNSNNGFSTQQIDISDFDFSSCYFRFRLVSDSSFQGFGVAVDNVEISVVDPLDRDNAASQFNNGTSFSAPMVSGVAALVMSQRPDLSAAQVKAILLNSVRAVPSLVGKVRSGGMLDAAHALKIADEMPFAPTIVNHPTNSTVNVGNPISLSVSASGTADLKYQWFLGGTPIFGATSPTYTISSVNESDAGDYRAEVSNSGGSVRSNVAVVTVNVVETRSILSNLSVRTSLTTAQNLVVGAVVQGGAKNILMRSGGPALNQFGLAGMPDPKMDLFGSDQVLKSTNDDWDSSLRGSFATVGAYSFENGSKDSALVQQLDGPFTVRVGGNGAGGTVLVEAYDLSGGTSPRLVNVSARNKVGTGSDILIAGFVIQGTVPMKVLIRAVGPTLADFGLTDVLTDPKVEVYNSSNSKIFENDNWSSSLSSTFSTVGAFMLPAGSKDSALVAELPPGAYTVQASGADGGVGEAIIEIYEVE